MKPTLPRALRKLIKLCLPVVLLALLAFDVAWVKRIYEDNWYSWQTPLIHYIWPISGDGSGGRAYYYFELSPGTTGRLVTRGANPDLYLGQHRPTPIARYSIVSSEYRQHGPWVPVLLHDASADEIVDATTGLPVSDLEAQFVREAMATWWGGGRGSQRILDGNFDRHTILWGGVFHTLATIVVLVLFIAITCLHTYRGARSLRDRRRSKSSRCISCNYPVLNLPRCPECGTLTPSIPHAQPHATQVHDTAYASDHAFPAHQPG